MVSGYDQFRLLNFFMKKLLIILLVALSACNNKGKDGTEKKGSAMNNTSMSGPGYDMNNSAGAKSLRQPLTINSRSIYNYCF